MDQLLSRLEGAAAQFAFTLQPPPILHSYAYLVAAMNCRFRVIKTSRAMVAKFTRRSQRQKETIVDYAAGLKQLCDKAHRDRDRITRDEDLLMVFKTTL